MKYAKLKINNPNQNWCDTAIGVYPTNPTPPPQQTFRPLPVNLGS